MENNNKKVVNKIRQRKPTLFKQEVFTIVTQEQDNKFLKVIRSIRSKYRFRLSDGIIVLGIFGFYGVIITLWKNYYYDALRTTYPHQMKFVLWGMFPYVHQRQPKEPFLYQPRESEIRDVELYDKYQDNKNNILFNKNQQYEVVIRGAKEWMVPALDHREIDTTDFQNLQQINFDTNALNALKKGVNKEMVDKGVISDDILYMKEKVESMYKVSEYKYKDDLYKELLELVKIK